MTPLDMQPRTTDAASSWPKPRPAARPPARAAPPKPAPIFDRATLLGAAAIALLAVAAFSPAAGNGFVWDDKMYVLENELLAAPGGLSKIWLGLHLKSTDPIAFSCETPQYYPMVFTTFFLEHAIWGLDPAGYHWTNIGLQAANAILLMLLLRRLGFATGLAWVIAAVFAVHPVGTETVAWVSERKNLLSTFFYLAAFLAFVRFTDRGRKRSYLISLLLFVCALLSKSVTATLPVALVLGEWLRRRPLNVRLLARIAPFLVLGLASGLLTANIERFDVGAEGAEWDFNFLERCLIASRALCFYAWKLIAPVDLAFIYERWEIDAGALIQYVYPLAVAAAFAAAFFFRGVVGRKPLFGLCFFAVTLSPALGFVNFYPQRFSFVADHFQYLAAAGFLLAVATPAGRALDRIPKEGMRQAVAVALPAAALAIMTYLSREQCAVYESEETLWSDTIAANPRDFIGHTNLGFYYLQTGRLQEAEVQFGSAVANKPDFIPALQNLAGILLTNKKAAAAEPIIRQAIALKPDLAESHNILGGVLRWLGRYEEAEHSFLEAIRLDPQKYQPSGNIAGMAEAQGRLDVAEEHYRRVIALKPGSVTARVRLAQVLLKAGRPREAVAALREALAVNPADPAVQISLARILATSGDAGVRNGEEAVSLAEKACRTSDFKTREYVATLAAAFAEAGDFDSAVHYQRQLAETAQTSQKTEQVRLLRLYQSRTPLRE